MIADYNIELPFESQTEDVKKWINENVFSKQPQIEFEPQTFRVKYYIFPVDSECEMVREECYSEPYPSCLLDKELTYLRLI